MESAELLLKKLKKEEEILRLQQEVLEIEVQLYGRDKSKQIETIQKLRGDKCFERIMLEESLQEEQEEKIA